MREKTRTRTKKIAVLILTAITCLLMVVQVNAQNAAKKITGKVTSKTSGSAVVGATVYVKGTTTSATTDDNGNFSVTVAPGQTLEIFFVGFATKDITVGAANAINVALAENYSNLQDVVVVGYGRMKKTDLSSSQVTVSSQDIQKTVNTTFDQALQGRAANVYVSQPSGQPGAAPSVVIRGISSLTGSTQPLYVIDGVQIKPENPSDNPNAHPTGFTNILSSINPDDIETMNILQGPSA